MSPLTVSVSVQHTTRSVKATSSSTPRTSSSTPRTSRSTPISSRSVKATSSSTLGSTPWRKKWRTWTHYCGKRRLPSKTYAACSTTRCERLLFELSFAPSSFIMKKEEWAKRSLCRMHPPSSVITTPSCSGRRRVEFSCRVELYCTDSFTVYSFFTFFSQEHPKCNKNKRHLHQSFFLSHTHNNSTLARRSPEPPLRTSAVWCECVELHREVCRARVLVKLPSSGSRERDTQIAELCVCVGVRFL